MAESWLDDFDVMPTGFKEDFDIGRCNPCVYAKRVTAQDGFIFLGCAHKPYNGKWVAEIKDCPKGGDGDGWCYALPENATQSEVIHETDRPDWCPLMEVSNDTTPD